MSAELASILVLAGRLLIGGVFVFAGVRNVMNAEMLAQMMAARGAPQARLLLWAGIVLQIVCGVLLIAGYWTAVAAAGLIAFLVVATPMFHNFWDHQGLDRANRINGAASNVALVGGLFLAIAADQASLASNM